MLAFLQAHAFVLSCAGAFVAACGAIYGYIRYLKNKATSAELSTAKTEVSNALTQDSAAVTAQTQLDATKKTENNSEFQLTQTISQTDAKDTSEGDADVSSDLAKRGLR